MSLTLRAWAGSKDVELPTFDLPSLIAQSVVQVHAGSDWTLGPDTDRLEVLDGGNVSAIGLSQIVQLIEERHGVECTGSDKAYLSFVLARLSALVEHAQWSLPTNYLKLTRTLYGSQLAVPSSFLKPTQMRATVQVRLERAGLWGLGGDADAEEEMERKERLERFKDPASKAAEGLKDAKAEQSEKAKRAFAQIKIARIATEVFDVLQARLGKARYFAGRAYVRRAERPDLHRPSTLDAVVFAHLALLLYLPLPQDPLLHLLKVEYPKLVSHTERMREALFPLSRKSEWHVLSTTSSSGGLWSIVRSVFPPSQPATLKSRRQVPGKSWSETLFTDRNIWLVTAGGSAIAFALWQGVIEIPRTGWFQSDRRIDEDDD